MGEKKKRKPARREGARDPIAEFSIRGRRMKREKKR